jgi:YesN/AraC family two-component response regulator
MQSNLINLQKLTKTIKVLYVEDNTETRKEVLNMLEIFFNTILVAIDGEDGLEKYTKDIDTIDLIITDINMPNMDGLEMIRQIKVLKDDVSILVFSAYEDSHYLSKAIELHIDGFLLKPIMLENYMKIVEKVTTQIKIKKELFEYKQNLEQNVKDQVSKHREKDELLQNHA